MSISAKNSGAVLVGALFCLVLVLSATLRMWRLGNPYIYTDEAFTWRVAQMPLARLLFACAHDTHPPGHFLALKGWMAVFGDSPVALRSLSAVFGVMTVLLTWTVVRAICTWMPETAGAAAGAPCANGESGSGLCRNRPCWTPLLAMLLVAVHPIQVTYSRVARMYAQGVFLTALSTLFLLVALRPSTRHRAGVWAAYVATAWALCMTHNFGLFTVAAQAAFAALVHWTRRGDARALLNQVAQAGVAFATVAALYGVWLGTLARQWNRVWHDFWVPPLSIGETAEFMTTIAAGSDYPSTLASVLWLSAAATCLAAYSRRQALADWSLVLMALLPWVGAQAVTSLLARPIMQERYFLFSQYAFLLLWARMVGRAASPWTGMLVLCLVLIPASQGVVDHVRHLPPDQPAIVEVAQLLESQVQPGDVVMVERPGVLNYFRYYARNAQAPIHFRTPRSEGSRYGHVNHISALDPHELLSNGMPPAWAERVWWVMLGERDPAPTLDATWQYRERHRFAGWRGARELGALVSMCTVDLYERRVPP